MVIYAEKESAEGASICENGCQRVFSEAERILREILERKGIAGEALYKEILRLEPVFKEMAWTTMANPRKITCIAVFCGFVYIYRKGNHQVFASTKRANEARMANLAETGKIIVKKRKNGEVKVAKTPKWSMEFPSGLIDKQTLEMENNLASLSGLVTVALRAGISEKEIVRKLERLNCGRSCSFFLGKTITSCPAIFAFKISTLPKEDENLKE